MLRAKFISGVFLFFIAFTMFSCSRDPIPLNGSLPSEIKIQVNDSMFQRGEKLLNSIFDSVKGAANYNSVTWYDVSVFDRLNLREKAKEAFGCFDKSKKLYRDTSEASVKCLEKMAWCTHFQKDNFAYHKGITPLFHETLKHIDEAIRLTQILFPNSNYLSTLNEYGFEFSMPRFYMAVITPSQAEAEKIAWKYLKNAAAVSNRIKNNKNTLRLLRALPNDSLQNYFPEIELGRKTEGDTSLNVAKDIAAMFHKAWYSEFSKEQKPLAKELCDLGVKIFYEHKSDYQIYLLRDIGLFYQRQEKDLPTSLKYYLKAQELEEKNKMELYYTAFSIAGIYIELENYDRAKEQYQKAFSDTHLSPTDNECAWFGLVMCEQLRGNKKEALNIWREHIFDCPIMNGISGFPGWCNPEMRKKLKEKALDLISSVNAPNAKRIVEQDWTVE
ncbi:MAG: hypothetical protein K0S32_1151 [Bacteroidetes bacterium]|jgi:tetratricopeptide (TPR) repeat protein|nr:hypothetical protein [Bacteroidota bacterium]